MPRVKTITEQVVAGEGVFLDTDKVFRIHAGDPKQELHRDPVEPVLALVADLRALSLDYFGRQPNYEEISQLARQLDDALSYEYESAAVMPLVEQLIHRDYAAGERDRLHDVTRRVHEYIRDTVHEMLARPPERLDHLDAISTACSELPRVDLATLNHDLVLEEALAAAGIGYSDGFERLNEDVCFWVDDWDDASVRLLKLHGSLSWWAYRIPSEPWRGWVTARYTGDDPYHPRRLGGALGYPQDFRPIFLTGTFDKILSYETWIFPDQHLRFQEALRQASRAVVIGYGFGDKAINTRLIGWLARARENRLIICHPRPDQLRERARGAIQNYWGQWDADGQLAAISGGIADVDFAEIEPHLWAA